MSQPDAPFRLGILTQHPIPYHARRYRKYNLSENVEVIVFYCSKDGVEPTVLKNMGEVEIEWDIPLLEGYESEFLPNYAPEDIEGFFSRINPTIIKKILTYDLDALSIHGHNYLTYHLAIATARAIGLPLFTSSDTHLMLERPWLKKLLRKPLLSAFYTNFQAFLATGSKNREFIQSFGVEDKRIFSVPYSVDNEFFQSQKLDDEAKRNFRKQLGIGENSPIVLYVSKFLPRKRARDLLRAFDRLIRNNYSGHLIFVGDGKNRQKLERYVNTNNLSPHVTFAGFQNQSELPKWYSLGDIFVLPSENEPWGMVINEAMNFAMPVVTTTDVGAGYDLVLEGETGYTYPPGNIQKLVASLKKLIDNPPKRNRMGQNALNRINNWSYEEAVEGMVSALEAAAQRTPKRYTLFREFKSKLKSFLGTGSV